MISGLDTTFLVEVEVAEHENNAAARALLTNMITAGDRIALAPQVLAEFVHVITDARRFERPLNMEAALTRAQLWWQSAETKQVFPNERSVAFFTSWMSSNNLGRKRILDTLLAATYLSNGIECIVSSNARDYSAFDGIEVIKP